MMGRVPTLVAVALLSCKATWVPHAATDPDEAPPFVAATPVQKGAGFFRRSYALGGNRVEVTTARMGGDRVTYESWVANGRDYPQVEAFPPEQANGFFTWTDDRQTVCDVHIQFRSGFHVEGRGNGLVAKADIEKLLAKLNLALLAESPDMSL